MNTQTKGRFNDLFKNKGGRLITTPGIHTNLKLTAEYVKAVSATSNNPYEAIKVTLTNEDGDTFSKLLLKPSKGYPKNIKREDGTEYTESDSEALYRAENESLAFIAKAAFLTNANIIEDDADYEKMANNLIKVIKSDDTVRFNVKLVLDKNDKYLELPRYADSAIELYKEGKESKLKISERDNMGNKPESNPFGVSTDSGELPF